jgi:hypothetical protein
MNGQPPHLCPSMADALSERLRVVRYLPKFREYGLPVHNGGTSKLSISFCPFCGVVLPSSVRDEWFDRLEALGLEPGDEAIPEALLTDEWWAQSE